MGTANGSGKKHLFSNSVFLQGLGDGQERLKQALLSQLIGFDTKSKGPASRKHLCNGKAGRSDACGAISNQALLLSSTKDVSLSALSAWRLM